MKALKAHRYNRLMAGDEVNGLTLCGRIIARTRLMSAMGDDCAVCEKAAAAEYRRQAERRASEFMRRFEQAQRQA